MTLINLKNWEFTSIKGGESNLKYYKEIEAWIFYFHGSFEEVKQFRGEDDDVKTQMGEILE